MKEVELLIDKSKAGLCSENFIKQESEEILQKLADIWVRGNLQSKRIMQGVIFPKGLIYNKNADCLSTTELAKGFYLSNDTV